MEKNRRKALRLQRNRKIKAKRKHYHFSGDTPRKQGMVYQTPTLCSCWMCGNPRKWFKYSTLKEERFNAIYKEELKQL